MHDYLETKHSSEQGPRLSNNKASRTFFHIQCRDHLRGKCLRRRDTCKFGPHGHSKSEPVGQNSRYNKSREKQIQFVKNGHLQISLSEQNHLPDFGEYYEASLGREKLWILEPDISAHVVSDPSICFNVKKTRTSTKIDGNEYISHFTGKCKISLVVREKATTINLVNVRIIPSLKVHFLSVAKFEDKGCFIRKKSGRITIIDPDVHDTNPLIEASIIGRLGFLPVVKSLLPHIATASTNAQYTTYAQSLQGIALAAKMHGKSTRCKETNVNVDYVYSAHDSKTHQNAPGVISAETVASKLIADDISTITSVTSDTTGSTITNTSDTISPIYIHTDTTDINLETPVASTNKIFTANTSTDISMHATTNSPNTDICKTHTDSMLAAAVDALAAVVAIMGIAAVKNQLHTMSENNMHTQNNFYMPKECAHNTSNTPAKRVLTIAGNNMHAHNISNIPARSVHNPTEGNNVHISDTSYKPRNTYITHASNTAIVDTPVNVAADNTLTNTAALNEIHNLNISNTLSNNSGYKYNIYDYPTHANAVAAASAAVTAASAAITAANLTISAAVALSTAAPTSTSASASAAPTGAAAFTFAAAKSTSAAAVSTTSAAAVSTTSAAINVASSDTNASIATAAAAKSFSASNAAPATHFSAGNAAPATHCLAGNAASDTHCLAGNAASDTHCLAGNAASDTHCLAGNTTAPNTHCFTGNIAPAHNYLNNNKYIHKKCSTSKPANTSTDHNLPKHLHTALTARCIRYIRNSIRNTKCYDKLRCHTDLSLDSDGTKNSTNLGRTSRSPSPSVVKEYEKFSSTRFIEAETSHWN